LHGRFASRLARLGQESRAGGASCLEGRAPCGASCLDETWAPFGASSLDGTGAHPAPCPDQARAPFGAPCL